MLDLLSTNSPRTLTVSWTSTRCLPSGLCLASSVKHFQPSSFMKAKVLSKLALNEAGSAGHRYLGSLGRSYVRGQPRDQRGC